MGEEEALLIIIKRGKAMPGIAQEAKSLPNTNEEAKMLKINIHKVKTTRIRVHFMPKTTGNVRRPASRSPIMSSPSFNISLGRLSKKISKGGSIAFFKFKKAEEARAPTMVVMESNKATVRLPIRGRFFRNGVYVTSRTVAARPIFNRFMLTKANKTLPVINKEIEIDRTCFFVSLPEGISLSGLFILSAVTSK
jgi:hypothetical protein